MSLKAFHIFFISLSVILALGFGVWGIRDYTLSGNTGNLSLGLASLVSSAGIIFYLVWFLRKIRQWKSALLSQH